MIVLDFPATPPGPPENGPGLDAALGTSTVEVHRSRFDLLALVAEESTVRALQPDSMALRRLPARGVIVTARADAGRPYHFVSRFFAPSAGVDEDPVTGSAHCCLAPFWADRLGRDELVGYQASPRGGTVSCRVVGDRVELGGRAVTILRGELVVE